MSGRDELAEVAAVGGRLANCYVDPILRGRINWAVEDVFDVAVEVADIKEILKLSFRERREVIAVAVDVISAPVLDTSEGVESIFRKTLGDLFVWG